MAATAYSSLVSLMIVLTRYQNPTCPAHFNQSQIQTMLDKVTSLVDFLEDYYDSRRNTKTSRGSIIQALERKITTAANAAEDIVESYYVDRVLDGDRLDLYACSRIIYEMDLEKAMHEMDEIVQESLEAGVKKNKSESDDSMGSFLSQSTDSNQESGSMPTHQENPLVLTLTPTTESLLPNLNDNIATSSSSFPPRDKNTMEDLASSTKTTIHVHSSSSSRDTNIVEGSGQQLDRLMKLIGMRSRKRETISIVGMGGIGKTTLATNAFNSPYACSHFDIRAWVTISQQYVVKNIIASLLRDMEVQVRGNDDVEVLKEMLHKHLYSRRYLIVVDDIWDVQTWNEIMRFFPDNRNGSRILLTTRDHSVARSVDSSSTYEMEFLNDDESFNLLSEKVYASEVFPSELEILGKAVAKSCKGLPLAIVVIGGLLKTSSKVLEYWKEFAESLGSIISKDNGGQCLGVLSLSYTHLPIHLKPCFLYMATFKEDAEIEVSNLINLWIAEGFLKPSNDKNLNDTALEYLNDLIDRNLIVDGGQRNLWGERSRIVNMHDSLRELCLREAENEDFLCVVDEDTPNLQQRLQRARRIVFKHSNYESKVLLPSMPYARSISIIGDWKSSTQLASSCRLLRVINNMEISKSQMDILKLVNVRYLKNNSEWEVDKKWDSLPLFWNLETFICDTGGHEFEIWDLQYLRYLCSYRVNLGPPGSQSNCVLKNLQTIWRVINFCTDEVFRRIPNLKELNVEYVASSINYDEVSHSLSNLARLPNLEILHVSFFGRFRSNIRFAAFPRNLVELYLSGSFIPWENMTIVGCLPNLVVLELRDNAFCDKEWNPSKGEFQRLNELSISSCFLKTWDAESCHFPRLEHLILYNLDLKEIPLGIGEIDTLKSIELKTKEVSMIISAKEIMEERRNYQGDDDNLLVKAFLCEVMVPISSQSNCVLNLQRIWGVADFFCTDEVFRRIPNLKQLKVTYNTASINNYVELSHSFSNLARLPNLEILRVSISFFGFPRINIRFAAFPHNLVQLKLKGSFIPWENMTIVGCLPNLQLLDLQGNAFCGDDWNPSEGEFQSLKQLSIWLCSLRTWNAESCHFPRLEHLKLYLLDLKEIPLTFLHNLVQLYLKGSEIPWENMTIVGCLPNLEKLELWMNACCGNEWNPSEGEFQSLKYLSIDGCHLRTWNAESCHFPRLEHLKLYELTLKKIPLGIGEIDTLEYIYLDTKKISMIISVKEIMEERGNNQGDNDNLLVECSYMDEWSDWIVKGDKRSKEWSEKWLEVTKWAENHPNFRIHHNIESLDYYTSEGTSEE